MNTMNRYKTNQWTLPRNKLMHKTRNLSWHGVRRDNIKARASGNNNNNSSAPKETNASQAKQNTVDSKNGAKGKAEDKLQAFESYYDRKSYDESGDSWTSVPDLDEIEYGYGDESTSPTTSMDEEKLTAFENYYTQLADEERDVEEQARRQKQYFASASEGAKGIEALFQIGIVSTVAWVSGYLALSTGNAVPPPRVVELFGLVLALGFEAEKVIVSRLPNAAKRYATLLEFVVQVTGWTYVLLSAVKGPLLFELIPTPQPGANLAGDSFVAVLPSLFVTVYAARALNRWKRRALRRAAEAQLTREDLFEPGTKGNKPLMSNAAAANAYVVADRILTPLVWLASVVLALDQLGVPLRPLLTFGGVAGLAVGFAAQQVVSNLFGGLVLNTTTPFARNDLICDSKGNFEGFVDKVGWFITRLQCPAGPVFIPNSVFLSSVVTNKTSVYGRRRQGQLLALTISVRHSDIYLVDRVIREIRRVIDKVDAGPDGGIIDEGRPVRVYVCAIGAKSIDIGVSCGLTSGSTEDFLAARSKMFVVIVKAVLSTGAQIAPRFEEHEDRKTLAYPRYEDLWRWAGGSVPEVPFPSEQGSGGLSEMLNAELGKDGRME